MLLALLAKEVALLGAGVLLLESALRLQRRDQPARALFPAAARTVVGVGVWWALRSQSGGNALTLHDLRGFLSGVGHHVFLNRAAAPAEIGPVIAFTASARNTYMTGANINVDGGSDFT